MLKVGDKVICKNNKGVFKYHGDIRFKIGETYVIKRINVDYVEINQSGFKIISQNDCFNFDDFFMTLKEYRKQKLKRICSSQETK